MTCEDGLAEAALYPPYPGALAQSTGELGEVGQDEVGLVRRLAERPLAPVDESRAHAVGFGADAVEGMVGDERDARAVLADDLLGLGVGLPVRLEIARFLHRDHVVEGEADMRAGRLQH